MAGLNFSIFMSIFGFIYLFFLAISVSIILYLIVDYTFESISIMCIGKS